MLARSASATFLTSASKTHPLVPFGIMTRTYFPLRWPITQRKSVLAFTVVAAAACAFGATLMAVFLFVVTWPNTGVSSSATAVDVTNTGDATKAMINRRRFILSSFLDRTSSLGRSDSLELRPQIAGMRNLGMVNRCQLRLFDPSCLAVVACSGQPESGSRTALDHRIAPVGRNSARKRPDTLDAHRDTTLGR